MTQQDRTKAIVSELKGSHEFYKAVKKSITHRTRRRRAGIYFSYAKVETNPPSQGTQDKPLPSRPSSKTWLLAGCVLALLVLLPFLTSVYPLGAKVWAESYAQLIHIIYDFCESTRVACEPALEQVRLQWDSLKAYDMDTCLKAYTESAIQRISQIRLWVDTVVESLVSGQDDDLHEIVEIELE